MTTALAIIALALAAFAAVAALDARRHARRNTEAVGTLADAVGISMRDLLVLTDTTTALAATSKAVA